MKNVMIGGLVIALGLVLGLEATARKTLVNWLRRSPWPPTQLTPGWPQPVPLYQ
jgi:hypothetical protein